MKRESLVKKRQTSGVDVPIVESGDVVAASLYYVSGDWYTAFFITKLTCSLLG